ncbi:MAG: ABC transporter permease [Firmicutes bacterium]|nr:ABC transporter permease [Bacillota bacterium]
MHIDLTFFTDPLKNLARRKTRTVLAIAGIAVGVFAFMIMGSLAEHFSRISFQFRKLFENRVFVCEKVSFWAGGGILSEGKADKVRAVNGVKDVIPVLIFRLNEKRVVMMGLPRVVVGLPPEKLTVLTGGFKAAKGELSLPPGFVVTGRDVASEMGLSVGSTIPVRDREYKVNGIIEKTGGLTDGQVFMPLTEAQELYDRKGLITSIFVIPGDGVNPDEMAASIKKGVKGVEVVTPDMIKNQVSSSLVLWNAITAGGALAAILSGSLCIIIVMLSAVSERTAEIGLKKTMGASTGQIMSEFLCESAIISFAGWTVGAAASIVFVRLTSGWMIANGANLFDPTLRLFLAGLAGSMTIGILSGIYPAYRAAIINPIEALKIKF